MSRDPHILTLYMSHRGELVNYASRILGDRGHAEDVVQEAYLRFDDAAGKRPLGKPVAYLYRTVRHLALDVKRHLVRDSGWMVGGEHAEQVAEQRPSPEAEIAARNDLENMAAAMAELPERTRIALELHRFGEWTLKDIAVHLGISVGLAHALVVDGLEHCRERLHRR